MCAYLCLCVYVCSALQVPVSFDGSLPPVLADASGSITAAYWQHHFRRLFQKQLLLLLLPTVCDLVGAALLNIGAFGGGMGVACV